MFPSLDVCNLTKNFGNITAVDSVSFKADKGEIIALLGPNGAGKSTLMNMIVGYLAPTSGNVSVFGKNIQESPLETKAQIGFLSEGAPLYPDMSVAAFLKYMAELKGISKKNINSAIEHVINCAKIENILKQKIETLSKGYVRRVGFAQSLLGNPDILLLDEPTDGLDPNQKTHIRSFISEIGENKTIIISTHLLEEAETIANRIILIDKGKIMADGSLAKILEKNKCKNLNELFKKLTTQSEEK